MNGREGRFKVFVAKEIQSSYVEVEIIKGFTIKDLLIEVSKKMLSEKNGKILAVAKFSSIFFEKNGSEVSSIEVLRPNDHLIVKYQGNNRIEEEKNSKTTESEILPRNGVFRILHPPMKNINPLLIPDEIIADMVQEESFYSEDEQKDKTSFKSFRFMLRQCIANLNYNLIFIYDYFMTNHQFLSILIVHFRCPLILIEKDSPRTPGRTRTLPPGGKSNSAMPTYGITIKMIEYNTREQNQKKILNVIKKWVDLRYSNCDSICLELIEDFVNFLTTSSLRLSEFAKELNLELEIQKKNKKMIERFIRLSVPNIIYTPTNVKINQILALEIACQLTAGDQILLHEMKMTEFVKQSTCKSLNKWKSRFSYISRWVIYNITINYQNNSQNNLLDNLDNFTFNSSKEMSLIIIHFILVMLHLKNLQNFNSMMIIGYTLSSSPISNLTEAWQGVPSFYQSLQQSITSYTSTSDYKNKILNLKPPCIPYIESDLIELNELDHLGPLFDKSNFINVEKIDASSSVIRHLIYFQSFAYNIKSNNLIYSLIEQIQIPKKSILVEACKKKLPNNQSPIENLKDPNIIKSSYKLTKLSLSTNSISKKEKELKSEKISKSDKKEKLSSTSLSSLKMILKTDQNNKNAKDNVFLSTRIDNESVNKNENNQNEKNENNEKNEKNGKKLEKNDKDEKKKSEKDSQKKIKSFEKSSKKVVSLLTYNLSLEQALSNANIFENFKSFYFLKDATDIVNCIDFYKAVYDFKKLFKNETDNPSKKAQEVAFKIIQSFLIPKSVLESLSISSTLDIQLVQMQFKIDNAQFSSNLFDHIINDILKKLNSDFSIYKTQQTLSINSKK